MGKVYFIKMKQGLNKVKVVKLLQNMPQPKWVMHPKSSRSVHPVFDMDLIETVEGVHRTPVGFRDHLTYGLCSITRKSFDFFSGYKEHMDTNRWLTRIIVLQTVAGIPGMVGGVLRHMRSLRTLERDQGWINHLLSEAENERMHLFIFMKLKNPGFAFRCVIMAAQGIMFNALFFSYLLSPKTVHRFVGYLEESAVHTYTVLLKDIDTPGSGVAHWKNIPAPEDVREYYNLPDDANFRDVVLCVRADEACHRDSNHTFASMESSDYVETHDIVFNEDMRLATRGEVDIKEDFEDNIKCPEKNSQYIRTDEPM